MRLLLLLALACSTSSEEIEEGTDASEAATEEVAPEEPSAEEPTDVDPEPDVAPTEEPELEEPAGEEDPAGTHVDPTTGPDVTGLVFFLLDRDHHEAECEGVAWEQPSIDDYRETPKSHLPESCALPPEKYPAGYAAEE